MPSHFTVTSNVAVRRWCGGRKIPHLATGKYLLSQNFL